MGGSDERQTHDERTRDGEGQEEAHEEYTTYREVNPGTGSPGEAGARREADLQPAPTREGERDPEAGEDQAS
jgi:hypothetical protein